MSETEVCYQQIKRLNRLNDIKDLLIIALTDGDQERARDLKRILAEQNRTAQGGN